MIKTLLKIKEQLMEASIIIVISTFILCALDHTHWNGIDEESDISLYEKLTNRFYFTTSTFSSVGYGDITPKSNLARSIVMVIHLLVVINIVSLIGKH